MNRAGHGRKALFFTLSLSIAAPALLVACGGGDDAPATQAPGSPAPGSPAPSPAPTPAPAPQPGPPASPPPTPAPPVPAPPPPAPAPSGAPFGVDITSSTATAPPTGVVPRLVTLPAVLNTPWGLAFLPDGRMLVTQKGGTLVLVSADGATVTPVSGAPAAESSGQGGLLDVALDPQFDLATNRRIYLAFSQPAGGGQSRTAVARADLSANLGALQNVTVIFQQTPTKGSGSGHYGSRILFRADGTMFVTLGERQGSAPEAQQLTSQLGKVVRLQRDNGAIPADNPFASMGGNAAAVWSYGHRNPQAAAIHPATGELWVTEHGPQGGDEVNLALAGRNFGWPIVSYGCNYGDPVGINCRIGGGVHNAPHTPPLAYWYPTSTAPGGAMFYTGARFPEWQGNLFVGGLAGRTLYRFVLNGNAVVGHEPLLFNQHEIRDLKQGPDGWIYFLSRNANRIVRIER